MTRNRSHGFFGTTAGAAAISACLVLVLFGSRPTNAGSGARQKHAAVSRDVAIDGQLAQEGEGWVIKLKAVNSGAKAQQCNVAAALTSVRSNMMSRAMPTPKTLWKSTVVVNVPASGASDEQTLQVPAEFAKRLAAKGKAAKAQNAEEFQDRENINVRFQADCSADTTDKVSSAGSADRGQAAAL